MASWATTAASIWTATPLVEFERSRFVRSQGPHTRCPSCFQGSAAPGRPSKRYKFQLMIVSSTCIAGIARGVTDAQHGDYATETWTFQATEQFSFLTFRSLDQHEDSGGAVIEQITITKN